MLNAVKFWVVWNGFGALMLACMVLSLRKERTWPSGMWDRYSEPIMFWITQSLSGAGIVLVIASDLAMCAVKIFKL